MAFRKKMKRSASKKQFRAKAGVHKRNFQHTSRSMRGGIRA